MKTDRVRWRILVELDRELDNPLISVAHYCALAWIREKVRKGLGI